MKILLINPEKLIVPPFGLLYIGSTLKGRGYDVELLEAPYAICSEERAGVVFAAIERYKPDLVGITCISMQTGLVKDLVGRIKAGYASLPVIVGGVHPTLESHDVLSWGADVAVRGEGERTAVELMEYFDGKRAAGTIDGISYKTGAGISDNPDRGLIRDLDEIPELAYDLLEGSRFSKRNYAIRGFWMRNGAILTARGCPGRCIFCASQAMHGRAVREFSLKRMLDEVERLKEIYSIEGLWIADDTFLIKEKRVLGFCEGLKERRLDLKWACQARVDTFTEKMARAMKRSGCVQIDFGVESGSQRVLDYVKKDIKIEETKHAFRIAKANGLRVLATVMVGLPTETKEDFEMTDSLLKEIRPNFVVPSFTTPFPGTELRDMAIKEGWLDASRETKWQSTEAPHMAINMSNAEMQDAFNRLMEYNESTFVDYVFNPRFLFDMFKLFASRPRYILKSIYYAVRGDRKEIMNYFLYIFRKEMIR